MLREYLISSIINTPLEGFAHRVRDLLSARERRKHPELAEIHAEEGRMQEAMRRLIRDPMNCLDLGCHLGTVTAFFQRLSPHGRHLAVEPTPYKARWLRRKFPRVDVRQIALGDRPGEVEFFFDTKQTGFSGLRPPTEQTRLESYKVKCERLDDVIAPDQRVDFIKIDVNGAELSVFRGAEKLLARWHPPILFECALDTLEAYQVTPQEMFDFFPAHGYGVYLLRDWLQGGPRLTFEPFVRAMTYPYQAFNFLAVATPPA